MYARAQKKLKIRIRTYTGAQKKLTSHKHMLKRAQ